MSNLFVPTAKKSIFCYKNSDHLPSYMVEITLYDNVVFFWVFEIMNRFFELFFFIFPPMKNITFRQVLSSKQWDMTICQIFDFLKTKLINYFFLYCHKNLIIWQVFWCKLHSNKTLLYIMYWYMLVFLWIFEMLMNLRDIMYLL